MKVDDLLWLLLKGTAKKKKKKKRCFDDKCSSGTRSSGHRGHSV